MKATHYGELTLGSAQIPCAVLEDKTRILRERSIARAFKIRGGGAHWKRKKSPESGALLPEYVSAKNLTPFIDDDIKEKLLNPITYFDKKGNQWQGTPAILLPEICDIWLKARENGALSLTQLKTAREAEIVLKGFAHVGIIALVDEATGYQDERVKDALQKILAKYVSEEAKPWVLTFDIDFYKLIFSLNKWPFDPTTVKRPSVIGHWTNDIYDRLAPGIREELHKVVKRTKDGRPSERLHQHIKLEAHPELVAYLTAVKALMRAAPDWRSFQRLLQRAYPKLGTNLELLLEDELYIRNL